MRVADCLPNIPEYQLTLHGDGVIAPAQQAALLASEAVGTCIRALNTDDCAPSEGWGDAIKIQLKGLDYPPEQRRQIFVRWVLSKGFQELARGLRFSLQEALFFIEMMKGPPRRVMKADQLQREIKDLRATAARLNFPELRQLVNVGLREPLSWEREFQSFQNIRNCLEHRDGRVSHRDLDPKTGTLLLTFPRFKMFYMRNGAEIELTPPCELNTSDEDIENECGRQRPNKRTR